MAVARHALTRNSRKLLDKLQLIADVPDSLKCLSCAAVFKYPKDKTRHYLPKPGKSVCTRVPLAVGNSARQKNAQLSTVPPVPAAPRAAITEKYSMKPIKKPPARKFTADRCIPSFYLRLPWYDRPTYAPRDLVRTMATKEITYKVCIEAYIVDPLVLYEYFKKKKVFSAGKGLLRDTDAMRIAQWSACKALEDHYGLEIGSAWYKRQTKRLSYYLFRSCPTPSWM